MSHLTDDVAECEICQENVDTEELIRCETCGRVICSNCAGGGLGGLGPNLCYECFDSEEENEE